MLFGGHAIIPLLLAGILIVGVLIVVGWAVFKSFQKSTSAWRVIAVSSLMTVVTVSAFIGWWFIGIQGPIGDLVPFHSSWANLLWLGFLVIPVAGFVSTVWLTGRVARNKSQASD